MTDRNQAPIKSDASLAVRLNRWALGLSRHWLRWILLVIGLYVGLPFLAPTLMHFGLTGPAKALYTTYSPLCHQFAFRSWFLFGEQAAYPRATANVPGLKPFESYAGEILGPSQAQINLTDWDNQLIFLAREFEGNERMGYKVALCERDIAIYGALFVFGLLFGIPFVRQRLRPVPLWLYILLGIMPIAIDGFSQLLGYPPFNLWPPRETSPFFRTLTGAMFGLMNGWLAFPYLEESAHQAAMQIAAKFSARDARRASEQGEIQ
jgi:uncharacterized membrane protein